MAVYASFWMDGLWWIVGIATVLTALVAVGAGLTQLVIIVLAVIVYPFRYLRRAYRVLRATSGEFDHDGYRKVRNREGYGFHYEGGWDGPIYPLDYPWPKRVDSWHSEPLWCVGTSYKRDRYWFCKRDGRGFDPLPKRLRGLDPKEAFLELDEAATGSRWGIDDEASLADESRDWERPPERDRTPIKCPHCGRTCTGEDGFLQHRRDKHDIPKGAPLPEALDA